MKGVVLDNGSIIDCFVYIVILDSACGSPCADKLVVALQKTILVNLYLRPWLMPRESTWGPKNQVYFHLTIAISQQVHKSLLDPFSCWGPAATKTAPTLHYDAPECIFVIIGLSIN